MNYKEFYLSLPIKDINVPLIDGVVQGDNANMIHLVLVDNEKPYDFSGFTNIELSIDGVDNISIQSVIASADEYNTENPYMLQVVDAKEGRISLSLGGLATSKIGTYYVRMRIFANNTLLTTSRFNYHVCETGKNIPLTKYNEAFQLSGLPNVLNQVSGYGAAETERRMAEEQRKIAEAAREQAEASRWESVGKIIEISEGFEEKYESVKHYADEAEKWANLAQNPSHTAIKEILTELGIPDSAESFQAIFKQYLQENGINGNQVKVTIKTGENPNLQDGEIWFNSEDKTLYIQKDNQLYPAVQKNIVDNTAPANPYVGMFWVEQSTGFLKYWNGSAWVNVKSQAVYT